MDGMPDEFQVTNRPAESAAELDGSAVGVREPHSAIPQVAATHELSNDRAVGWPFGCRVVERPISVNCPSLKLRLQRLVEASKFDAMELNITMFVSTP